jgi:multicomponent Na+:H+ antiporter subunit F
MSPMNAWMWAAAGILVALIPCGIVCYRGKLEDRLIGLEMAGALVTIELLLLAEGYGRSSFFDIALTLAFLSFGGGMVFARFVQRWL